jgi:aspartyl/asparaginyl beta-hydroxylase (cupin superfamily)
VPEVEAYGKQQAAIAQATQQAEMAQAQQQEQLKQQRQEALRLQRQQELRSQAQDWLDHLDLKSTEGRWFEEFGCHYDSQIDAAIAYLEALQEVDRCLLGELF